MTNTHRLLLVDDDEDLRTTLAEQFALHDEFSVTQAENAAKAMAHIKGERTDLAIMDVGLPDMDGREAVKQMRRNGFPLPHHHAHRPDRRCRYDSGAGSGRE